jgi:hypothetical protein
VRGLQSITRREILGAVSEIWAVPLRPSIYMGRTIFERTPPVRSPILTFCASIFRSVVPSFTVQRIEEEQCLRVYASDLKTCTGASVSSFWKVRSHDHSCSSPTVSSLCFHMIYYRSTDLPFISHNDDPVVRSVIRLSYLCNST